VLAAKILERLGKHDPQRTLSVVTSFVKTLRNWEECDQLACFGLRCVVKRYPDHVLPWCDRWVKSEEKWTRRFGVAVLTSLPRDKDYQPSKREFEILEQVMTDPVREVQDAVSWALREIGKRHPSPVFDYLRRYAKSANRFTRRIVKQALKALPPADRDELGIMLSSSG
jgi:3-methyladenine DNA glycosylase AlkD